MKSFHNYLCHLYDRFKGSSLYNGFQWFVHGDIEHRLMRLSQYNIQVAVHHQQIFPQYKNCNAGKDVAVVACGPTLSEYLPISGAVHIAVNRAIKFDKVAFDYLFINDGGGAFTREEMDQLNAYRGDDCVKFYGLYGYPDSYEHCSIIPESDVIKAHAHRYYLDLKIPPCREYKMKFAFDLSTEPLIVPGTTAFAALQFALWTNPRRLYLVGCDCSHDGHFYSNAKNSDLKTDFMIEWYREFKHFAGIYYPDTEIISINPVGLKGLFVDQYQSGAKA